MEQALNEKEVLYNDEYLTLYYDHSISCIIKEWKQAISENKFRELIIELVMKIVQTRMKYKKPVNLIADCRKLGGDTFTPQVIDWLNTEVHRLYAMNKITRKAFVASKNITANLSIVSYISMSNPIEGFTMSIFDDMEDAKNWSKI
ncbi:MAG: STAS/SEC14 domain-containing protein [Raineya sp.]|jgi:superfamily II helicase|nr:STAS/SEC14 domain-containing protein [Raineya sp.]